MEPTPQDPSLLVVEDDREIGALLSEFLGREGYQVEVAGSGTAMDATLRRFEPDLVVLDLMLPGEDGLSICRRLRARSGADVPCAPERFSTMTCCPHISPSFAPRMRASASVPPPGGNGTMNRTGFSGNRSCAMPNAGIANVRSKTRRRFIIIAPRTPRNLASLLHL